MNTGHSVPITYIGKPTLNQAHPLDQVIDLLKAAGFQGKPELAKQLYLVLPTTIVKNKEWQHYLRERFPDLGRKVASQGLLAYRPGDLSIFGIRVIWSETTPQIRCGSVCDAAYFNSKNESKPFHSPPAVGGSSPGRKIHHLGDTPGSGQRPKKS